MLIVMFVPDSIPPHKLIPSRIDQLALAGAFAMSRVTCPCSSKQQKGAVGMALQHVSFEPILKGLLEVQ